MIMDRYSADVDFAYQVPTVLSLTMLNSFYGLELSFDQKDKLI